MAQKIAASAGKLAYRVNAGTFGSKYPVTILPATEGAHLTVNGDATTERSSYAVTVSQWNALYDAHGGDDDKIDAALSAATVTLADKPKGKRAGRAKVDQKSRLAKIGRR